MAKKKEENNNTLDIDNVIDEITNKYGDVVLSHELFIEKEREKKIVPVSPSVDIGLGGGISEGTWNIFSGQPKCGKTSTVLQICENAQRLYDKFVFYLSPEGRLKERDLAAFPGINKDKFKIIESTKGNILTAEKFLEIGRSAIKSIPECILVIDSSSALCAEAESTSDITAQGRNSGPKLLATFCRQMANIVPIQQTIILIIQHLIANTSGYGAKYIEDGGTKIRYQADNILRCKGVEKWKAGSAEDSEQVGQIISWEVVTSAINKPGSKIESYLRYGYGLDKETELLMICIDFGLIKKSGAWYQIGEEKFCGQDEARKALKENPSIYESLYKTVKQML